MKAILVFEPVSPVKPLTMTTQFIRGSDGGLAVPRRRGHGRGAQHLPPRQAPLASAAVGAAVGGRVGPADGARSGQRQDVEVGALPVPGGGQGAVPGPEGQGPILPQGSGRVLHGHLGGEA